MLVEVALRVQEPHSDDGDAQVRGALQVVARKNAESSRVDRYRLVESELGGEVGHRAGAEGAAGDVAPAPLPVEVLVKAVNGVVDAGLQCEFEGPALERLPRDRREKGDRVVVHPSPEGGVEVAEEGDHVGLPGPPEIASQLAQLGNDIHDVTPSLGHWLPRE